MRKGIVFEQCRKAFLVLKTKLKRNGTTQRWYREQQKCTQHAHKTKGAIANEQMKNRVEVLFQNAQEICHLVVTLGFISAPCLCKICFVFENRCLFSGSKIWLRIVSTAARTLHSLLNGPIWQQFTMARLRAGSSRCKTYSSSS